MESELIKYIIDGGVAGLCLVLMFILARSTIQNNTKAMDAMRLTLMMKRKEYKTREEESE